MRLCEFKLKGDSLGVPSINLDDVMLEITFTVTIILSFDVLNRKWSSPSEDFKLDIKAFKGPFVLTKGVVSAALSVAVPIIKKNVLKELPPELGLFVNSIPLPLTLRGTFSIDGELPLDSVFNSMFLSQSISDLTGYTPQLLLNFYGIQKSLGRKDVLNSIMDLMKYQRRFGEYSTQWNSIKALWDEAALIYFSKTVRKDGSSVYPKQQSGLWGEKQVCHQDFTGFLAFDNLLKGAESVRRNELNFMVDIVNVEGQIGLKSAVTNLHAYLIRIIQEVSNDECELSSTQSKLLLEASTLLSDLRSKFNLVLKHLDHIHNKVSVTMRSGAAASCDIVLKKFSAQLPVALWTSLPEDHVLTFEHFIIPTLINVKTLNNGIVNFRLFHMGCSDMLEQSNFEMFFKEYDSESTGETTLNYDMSKVNDEGYSKMGAEITSLSILRPQLALVLDNTREFQAGSALFTVNVGPLDSDWAPQGAESEDDRSYIADIKPLGDACPILIQTSNQVKLSVKAPMLSAHIKLDNLVRYFQDHFQRLDKLLHLLSTISCDEDANMQYLNFSNLLVSLLSKYVKMPTFEVQMDVSINMISNAGDVIVCIENHKQDLSVLVAHAKMNIGELIKDTAGLKSAFFNCLN